MENQQEKYQPQAKELLFNFGETIKRKREEMGKTLKELADEIGIDSTYLCKFENNYQIRPAKEPVIRSLAIALGFQPEWLLLKCGKLPYKYQDYLKQNPDYFLKLFEGLECDSKK